MKIKRFVICDAAYIFVLCLGMGATYFFTAQHYRNLHQVNQWVYQNRLSVESFHASTDVEKRSMFHSSFYINLSIGGCLKSYGNGYALQIKNLHVSERLENIDNHKVTPIVDANLEKPLNDFKESFTYNYAYKVHTFFFL